jgi:hypothetical protein
MTKDNDEVGRWMMDADGGEDDDDDTTMMTIIVVVMMNLQKAHPDLNEG